MYWLEKETWEIGLFRPIGKTTQLTWPFNLWCFKICNVYEERGEWNRIISPMRSTYLQHWSQVRGGCQRAGILHFLTLHTCSRVCGLLIWQWRDISGVRECLANPPSLICQTATMPPQTFIWRKKTKSPHFHSAYFPINLGKRKKSGDWSLWLGALLAHGSIAHINGSFYLKMMMKQNIVVSKF